MEGKNVSDVFWQLVEEKIGILSLFNTKPKVFEASNSHVQLLLSKTETKGQIDQMNLLGPDYFQDWSSEAHLLYLLVQELGQVPDICNRHFVQDFFTRMCLAHRKITDIDSSLGFYFHRLQTLDLRHNSISVLENMPVSLQELQLSGNKISTINAKTFNCPSLLYITLSYNYLSDPVLHCLPECAPALLAVDVSHNQLINLEYCVGILSELNKVKVISMEGNPLTLAKNYRKFVMQKLMGRICHLDGGAIDIKKEAEKAEKIKKLEKKKLPNTSLKSFKKSEDSNPQNQISAFLDFEPEIKFELSLSVLSGVSGVFLTEEQIHDCVTPYEELQDQYKSSAFWVSFQGMEDELIELEKKYWLKDFQIDKEVNKGKTDFKFQIIQNLNSSLRLRDYIRSNPIFKVWRSDPLIQTNPEGEQEAIMEKGLPKLKKELIGVLSVASGAFLHCGKDEKFSPTIIHSKHQLFPPSLLIKPQYLVRNEFLKLEENDVGILVEHAEEEEKKKREAAMSELPDPEPAPPAKDAKKGADKKDAKGKKGDPKSLLDENIVEVQDPEDMKVENNLLILEKNPRTVGTLLKQLYPPPTKKSSEKKSGLALPERRKKALVDQFEVHFAAGPLLTVKLALNQEEPPKKEEEPIKSEQPTPTPDPKGSRGGAKKKGKK